MEFVNQTVIGSKELAALSKGARKTMRRNRNRMVRTMAALVSMALQAMTDTTIQVRIFPARAGRPSMPLDMGG